MTFNFKRQVNFTNIFNATIDIVICNRMANFEIRG